MIIDNIEINESAVPRHVAIIMDGNGRWAEKHGLSRSAGHKEGAKVVEPVTDAALKLGVEVISLYAFSIENWSRPKKEILSLWNILESFFTLNIDKIKEKGIKVQHTGSLKKLPPSTKKIIKKSIDETAQNKNLILNFCVNYGSQQEIVDAVNDWLSDRKDNEKITTKKLEKRLYTSGLPDVDLLIRTSGEYRISNFLLWQLAYSELVFQDVLWPDFKAEDLYKAVYEFQKRDRRYGGI